MKKLSNNEHRSLAERASQTANLTDAVEFIQKELRFNEIDRDRILFTNIEKDGDNYFDLWDSTDPTIRFDILFDYICIERQNHDDKIDAENFSKLQITINETPQEVFEELLIKNWGEWDLEKRQVTEEGVKLTLYYDHNQMTHRKVGGKEFSFPKHIGTWHKDGGWYSKPEKN